MTENKKHMAGDIIVDVDLNTFNISVETFGYHEQTGTKRKCSQDIDAVMEMIGGKSTGSKLKTETNKAIVVNKMKI